MLPRSTPAASQGHDPTVRKHPFRLLVVDRRPQFLRLLEKCAPTQPPMQVVQALSLAEARQRLAEGPIDLAIIDPDLPDGSGLALADELNRSRRLTATIVISEKPSLDVAIQALRAGACDYMIKPLDLARVNERVHKIMRKQKQDKVQAQRLRRLRRLCKNLNQARLEVSQKVDILCNDLVTAYQELACQMQQVDQSREYGMLVRDELDLERLLRKTLEYLVEKAGPTNAAFFLPATLEDFNLGGYVNYDCTADSADMLLEHLADVLAPKVAQRAQLVHVTDNKNLAYWIGDDAAYLEDCHLLAFACLHNGETLAVVTLFRDGATPYEDSLVETATTVGSMLGEALARLIRIHHRHLPDPWDDDEDGGVLS